MSKLQKAIEVFLAKSGSIKDLASQSFTSSGTISRARNGKKVLPKTAFNLAMACTLHEQSALQMASEYETKRKKK